MSVFIPLVLKWASKFQIDRISKHVMDAAQRGTGHPTIRHGNAPNHQSSIDFVMLMLLEQYYSVSNVLVCKLQVARTTVLAAPIETFWVLCLLGVNGRIQDTQLGRIQDTRLGRCAYVGHSRTHYYWLTCILDGTMLCRWISLVEAACAIWCQTTVKPRERTWVRNVKSE